MLIKNNRSSIHWGNKYQKPIPCAQSMVENTVRNIFCYHALMIGKNLQRRSCMVICPVTINTARRTPKGVTNNKIPEVHGLLSVIVLSYKLVFTNGGQDRHFTAHSMSKSLSKPSHLTNSKSSLKSLSSILQGLNIIQLQQKRDRKRLSLHSESNISNYKEVFYGSIF